MITIYDKLAKALAYRKYAFSAYCKAHEYEEDDTNAIESFLDCKFYSNQFIGLSDEDIEVLLNNQPIP